MNVLLLFFYILGIGVVVQLILIIIQDRLRTETYEKRLVELDKFYAEQKKQFDEICKEQLL